jgi:hypothetical protein
LLVPLEPLGLFGVVELPLLLLPLLPLLLPLAPPLGLLGVELLLPDAADGLFDVLLVLPALDWSRWQPASASARDAAMIISTFMDPPLERTRSPQQATGRTHPAVPSVGHEDHLH